MKRIINFTKEKDKYVFKEKNCNNKIEIDEIEKTLNGLELYNQFFNEYSIGDSFEIVDCSTEDDKKNDKLCYPIYMKVKELFNSINENLNIEVEKSSKEMQEKN